MYWYRIYYKYSGLRNVFSQLAYGGNELFKQIDLIVNVFKADILKVVCDKNLHELNNRYLHDMKKLEGDL